MKKILAVIGAIAEGYEPALVAAVVAATFTLLSGLGIAVGDFPEKVDAVLTFVGFLAPILAGLATRAKVTPVAKLQD